MTKTLWSLLWYSNNKLDGVRTHIIYEGCLPVLFRTRAKARAYAIKHYGYIRERDDLRGEPHGWRMPRIVKVRVVVDEWEV